jgi:hypothetical protein
MGIGNGSIIVRRVRFRVNLGFRFRVNVLRPFRGGVEASTRTHHRHTDEKSYTPHTRHLSRREDFQVSTISSPL